MILGEAYIQIHERAAQRAHKARWADKCPENVLYTWLWEKMLGQNWYFILVTRNPLDTIASIREVNFYNTIPPHLEKQIEFYLRYNNAGLEYASAHSARSYRLIYEQLVRSPEAEIGRLMRWLGEEAEPTQLHFNDQKHQAGLEDPKIQATDRVHGESVGRWKRDLRPEEISTIQHQTAALWEKLAGDGGDLSGS